MNQTNLSASVFSAFQASPRRAQNGKRSYFREICSCKKTANTIRISRRRERARGCSERQQQQGSREERKKKKATHNRAGRACIYGLSARGKNNLDPRAFLRCESLLHGCCCTQRETVQRALRFRVSPSARANA